MNKGSAPIFITTKMADLESLQSHAQLNPATGSPWDAQASIICRHLKIYKFPTRVAKPPKTIAYCGHCFSRLRKSRSLLRRAALARRLGGVVFV